MLVEILIDNDVGPRIIDFDSPPNTGDMVYIDTAQGEKMYVVGARFWRQTEKPEQSQVLGKDVKVMRRRHTLFIGLKLVTEVEALLKQGDLLEGDTAH
jgi:hypothetical protein